MTQLYVLVVALTLGVFAAVSVDEVRAAEVNDGRTCSFDATLASARAMTAELRSDAGPRIIPVAGKAVPGATASRLPPGSVDGLQAVRTKIGTLGTQVKSLQASLNQPAWNQAVQPQLAAARGTLASLQQDVAKLQAVNRSANMNVGVQVSDALQARAQDLGKALDGLSQARDATAARGALSQISLSLGNLTKTANDPPGCCQALTCCAIGIQ